MSSVEDLEACLSPEVLKPFLVTSIQKKTVTTVTGARWLGFCVPSPYAVA